jgi:hypothetical protein
VEGKPGAPRRGIVTAAAYVVLFLLGAVEGLIGCFQFSHTVGSVPVAALGFGVLLLVTCLLAAAGMGTALGGLVVAVGWLAASFVLTLPTPAGSVVVTNTSAGKWFLYGGAVFAAVGVTIGLRWRSRRPRGGRQQVRL